MNWVHYIVMLAIVVVCLLLITIILLQKGRGGGLSAAFGGAGSGSAFGAKTGDVFTWITVTFAALYLLLNVVGNFVFRQEVEASPIPALAPLDATEETAAPELPVDEAPTLPAEEPDFGLPPAGTTDPGLPVDTEPDEDSDAAAEAEAADPEPAAPESQETPPDETP